MIILYENIIHNHSVAYTGICHLHSQVIKGESRYGIYTTILRQEL